MKGLLLKEFYNLKMVFIFYILIVFFVGFIGIGTDIAGAEENLEKLPEEIQRLGIYTILPSIFIAGFYPGNMICSSYGFDEKAHWTPFILSVGIPKSKILASKVILHLISSLILIIPFLPALFLTNAKFDTNIYIGLILTFLTCCFISGSASILICTAIGSNKGVVIGSVVSIFTTALPMVLSLIPAVIPNMMHMFWIFGLINFLVLGLGLYILCYFISLAIFKKREF